MTAVRVKGFDRSGRPRPASDFASASPKPSPRTSGVAEYRRRTRLGHQIRNRRTWTVTDTHRDGSLTVADPDRGTVDVGIAVLEPSTTRNHAYDTMTRGRQASS